MSTEHELGWIQETLLSLRSTDERWREYDAYQRWLHQQLYGGLLRPRQGP